MIIEDDEEMRSLLRDFFEEEGFETDSASNGVDGLRMLSKDHFDLVITDIRMPGLTGLDILPRIRRLKPEVPIIVMTAHGSDGVRRRSLEGGATIYLEKPIHLSELRTMIREVLLRKEMGEGKTVMGKKESPSEVKKDNPIEETTEKKRLGSIPY